MSDQITKLENPSSSLTVCQKTCGILEKVEGFQQERVERAGSLVVKTLS